jgi:DNA-binding winged helix-turn-helix (wHTH) protein/tetratricopeptide (TPR) repeat protein
MAAKSCRFGPYTVDFARREIHRGSGRLDVPAKVFDCVTYLIEHRDRAVGRDELISAVWGRVDISDNLLAQIVLRARRAFDDDADAQRYIRTITGFGYRWVYEADVEEVAEPAAVMKSAPPPPESSELPSTRDERPAATLPHVALPASRRPDLVRILVVVFASLVLVKGAFYLASIRHSSPATPPPAKDLAFVLPAIVHDAPDFAWARLGVMDLVAQRLREAGQATVPSDTVVAVAKFAGETPTPAELGELTSATGAHAFYQPDVARERDLWKVTLRQLGDGDKPAAPEGIANDLVQATGAAIAQLTSALDLSPLPYNEGAGPGATLAQEVTSELLQDRIADARALIDKAPADVRNDPRVRLQSAAVDFYQSRLPEARATLEKLQSEATSERSPEFNARVTTALGSLAIRNHDYPEAERIATLSIDSLKDRDPASIGNALGSALMVRATARLSQGAYDKASDDFAAARVALTTTGNVRTLALVDSNSSMMEMNRDRFHEAVPGLTKSADYFHKLGAPIRELLDRNKIAACALALQDFKAAEAEDAKLAELIEHVEDPEVRNSAQWMRSEIAFALGRTRDAAALVDALLADMDLSDVVRGPTLLVNSRLAADRGDFAHVVASSRNALALKWADEQPREYATNWLLLARGDRKAAPDKTVDDVARARAWASASIYPSASLLADLVEAEQLAAENRDEPARAAFERALRATSEHEVPSDVVEVTTSYAAWLIAKRDLERALAVLGRNQAWSAANFQVAVAEARLYRALGNEKLWRAALDRAQQTAGERVIPNDVSSFEAAKTAGVIDPPQRLVRADRLRLKRGGRDANTIPLPASPLKGEGQKRDCTLDRLR